MGGWDMSECRWRVNVVSELYVGIIGVTMSLVRSVSSWGKVLGKNDV
jgi:hypothetical protein